MNCARRLLVALACAAACHAAQADRSRLADDADVVEAGDCEVETALERQSARAAAPQREASIQFGCGIGWRTELVLAVARRHSDAARDEAIGVEARTSLRERSSGRIGWTLAYGIGAERGGGRGPWRRNEQFVAIEATHQPDRAWLIEARLGTARDPVARSDRTLWALSAEHTVTETVEVRAEVGGDDRSPPLLSLGLRYRVWPERAAVTLSWAAATGPLRERRLGLGITFEF